MSYDMLNPIVSGWVGKIEEGLRAKKAFDDVADQCMAFFSHNSGFMWEKQFKSRFFGDAISPRFKMTIAKAFELVALFGPTLYWKNPTRACRVRKPIELDPALFTTPPNPMLMQQAQQDPMLQQFLQQQQMQQQMMFQQAQQTEQQRLAAGKMRSTLMEAYLNYTPGEQPGGGLAQHSETAITEALVKGRGCLWPEPYKMPGSQRMLTGCFFDSVDNLIVDPDAESLEDAFWIAKKCVHPVWQVEREYKLPKNSLEGKGDTESAYHQGESRGNDMANVKRERGLSFDLITYYKIWSKAGVGSRLTNVHTALSDHFDEVVGDYAYIVVAPNVPYPLNAPSETFASAVDESVRKMFQWPVPYWLDDRWPVCVLDFYRKPRCAWPIAPLAPGMGELVFLNVMISQLANRIWMSSRDFIAVLKSALPELESILRKGEDMAILPVKEIHQDIRKIITFLQQPQTNFDVWKIIEAVMELFDRRTGLSELFYGLNPGGAQIRTATDSQTKRELISVRPDYMAAKVETWQSQCARMEKFAARWYVQGPDVEPLLGPVGSQYWQTMISNEDPEKIVREMDATVEAGSSRKPNKERDAQNMNTVLPVLVPELSKQADVTGDTGPLNELMKQYGDSIDKDMTNLRLGPRVPAPPPPEMQQQQQQMMQMQMQSEQAKIQATQIKAQADQQRGQIDIAKGQLDLQREQLAAAAEQGKIAQEAQQAELEQYMRQQEFGQNIMQDQQIHLQDMVQDQQRHQQELQQAQQKGRLDLLLASAKAKQQAQAAKQQQAARKPSKNGAAA